MRHLLLLASAVLAVACTNATHIQLEPKQPILRSKLDAVQLVARVMSNNTEYPMERVQWSSQNPEIAVVDANGRVTGKAGGRTQIVATFDAITASVPVEVAFVESLRSDQTIIELSYEAGDPKKPKVDAIGYDGRPMKERRAFFKPKDDKICRVDGTGQFWPVNVGETAVVAELDGQTLEIGCVVKK